MKPHMDRHEWESTLAKVVREREDYNGKHQIACLEIERLREALQQIVTVINDNHKIRRKTMILRFVKQVADNAISGSFTPPITCRDVASCGRHGECMYLGCPARKLRASAHLIQT